MSARLGLNATCRSNCIPRRLRFPADLSERVDELSHAAHVADRAVRRISAAAHAGAQGRQGRSWRRQIVDQGRDQRPANQAASRDARGGRGADDARDRRAASVAGSDDGVLVQPLQRFRRQRPRPYLDRLVRGDCDSAAYVRQVPRRCSARPRIIRRCCSTSTTGRTPRPAVPARRASSRASTKTTRAS